MTGISWILFLVLLLKYSAKTTLGIFTSPQTWSQVLRDYHKDFPPSYYSKEPTVVNLELFVEDIKMDEKKGMLSANLYVVQTWRDARLLPYLDYPSLVTPSYIQHVWKPDTFVENAWAFRVLAQPQPCHTMQLDEEGRLRYGYKAVIDVGCPELYPSHESGPRKQCVIAMESVSFTMDDVKLAEDSFCSVRDDLFVPGYTFQGTESRNKTLHFSTGSFSRFECGLLFDKI